mmetsp:Transcript_33207/g.69883  ORF Transcript_33207/g.69883 Transcript_33207/m.69883 type:complete len:553 (-) Transcript_33207:331-1989(-)|eukprot:CAMPEP_0172306010 /NCGR_PEP_ID=MMETSP1058-20130122/7182_1 /TAXON_ID=83371 /ORGANISM="Detonula confervacea, Strain CCMP 353" /LENGTH=552 /DNA_ID=CAMNT_0013017781 /DNA_START=173 /DNA_END=1831 /DNA_ORIENTATION=+
MSSSQPAPSFSVGTTTTAPPVVVPMRRSTRRAARTATMRIAEEAAPQRRSTRLASRSTTTTTTTAAAPTSSAAGRSRGSNSNNNSRTSSSPMVRRNAPRAARGTKETPIVLDDEEIDEMDLKPAAKSLGGVAVASTSATGNAQKPPEDFTCAICLDAPPSMTEVATISGCTHQFCFDCIDKWAETENKCPCCKSRFRTIDRAVALPATPEARRGKRKRAAASSGSNTRARRGGAASSATGPSPRSNRRVNSRTVEDRNQQTATAFPINAALVEQILASFTSLNGPLRGTGQVTFGTSEDGRPQIRMIRPHGGGMVGVMEMFLPDGDGPPGAGGGAAAAAGAGGSSPTRTARVRFARAAPRSGSRRGSSGSSSGSATSSLAGLPPPLMEMMGRSSTSTSGSATARSAGALISTRPGSAGGSASASASARASNPHSSRAARQPGSAFASLFASLRDGGPRSSPDTRSGRGAAAAASAGGAEDGAAAAAAAGAGSNRVTIRFIARERVAAPSGSSASSRSRSHSPGSRSSSRRSPGGSAGGSGRGGSDDEPIIID